MALNWKPELHPPVQGMFQVVLIAMCMMLSLFNII